MRIGPGIFQGTGLAQRIFNAGGWTTAGYATSQVLRLAGNLILTRLLFPEAFGLMAIVQAVIIGCTLLSDVGIDQSIIRHARGHHSSFLNTAWTLKVIRGFAIWIALCLLAIPIATFYEQPMLAQLLPIVGLTAVIAGFTSTKMASADRNLSLSRKTIIEVGSYAFGLVVMIALALIYQSIWSLVIGNLVGSATGAIASHVVLDGIKNRLAWEKSSATAIMAFGRWILISSTLTFVVGEGSKLLVAHLLDVRMLAFLTLAMAINQLPQQFIRQVGSRVLFAAYSELHRERPERLYSAIAKARLTQIAPCWLGCVLLAYFGNQLMEFLYDERYKDSGWMLQLLAMGSLVGCLSVSYSGVLWAKGLARTATMLLAMQLLILVPTLFIGSYIGGVEGLVTALALVSWIVYPAHAYVYGRLSLWQPQIDLPVIGLSLLVVLFALASSYI
jgi:O-antigen/teichoic acid export membrane protein